MSEQARGPTLYGLLNQFEDISGPETYGPEGLAILIALWRKSNKLNWLPTFTMTNTELQVQTGIQTRKTLNVYRKKLVDGGLIEYIAPPLGTSRGDYHINFNLLEPFKPVTSGNNSNEKTLKLVTSGNSFEGVGQRVVTSGNDSRHTVLNEIKDVVVVDESDNREQRLRELIRSFCDLHQKFDINVKPRDIGIMQKVIALGVPLPLITKIMNQIYLDKKGDVSSFSYYERPIISAWELEQSITAEPALTEAVALGSYQNKQSTSSTRPVRYSKQSEQADMLKNFVQRQEAEHDPSRSRKIVHDHQLHLPDVHN